jgi:hypothetical protein
MKVWVGRLHPAAKAMVVVAAAAVVLVLLSGMAALPMAMAAVVEHTFVVSIMHEIYSVSFAYLPYFHA